MNLDLQVKMLEKSTNSPWFPIEGAYFKNGSTEIVPFKGVVGENQMIFKETITNDILFLDYSGFGSLTFGYENKFELAIPMEIQDGKKKHKFNVFRSDSILTLRFYSLNPEIIQHLKSSKRKNQVIINDNGLNLFASHCSLAKYRFNYRLAGSGKKRLSTKLIDLLSLGHLKIAS